MSVTSTAWDKCSFCCSAGRPVGAGLGRSFLPRCRAAMLRRGSRERTTVAQLGSTSASVRGSAGGLSAGAAVRGAVDRRRSPRGGGAAARRSAGARGLSDRIGWPLLRMAWRRKLTCPLALFLGHKVVAVAMTTTKPEVHALGGGGVVVVAGHPGAAGASSARQGARGALGWREEGTL